MLKDPIPPPSCLDWRRLSTHQRAQEAVEKEVVVNGESALATFNSPPPPPPKAGVVYLQSATTTESGRRVRQAQQDSTWKRPFIIFIDWLRLNRITTPATISRDSAEQVFRNNHLFFQVALLSSGTRGVESNEP